MREITLTRGKVALVDDQDYETVVGFNWHYLKSKATGYALRKTIKGESRTYESLHRRLTGALPGELVDHKNGDGLDCRRSNLRIATHQQNSMNRRKRSDSQGRFKGVQELPSGNFRARIKIDGIYRHIGVFASEEAAARAYDQEAIGLFGEFAKTNFSA